MSTAVDVCLADQTPTPTRFLRNCDEIGLFQEINPFDKDFKKAVEQQHSSASVDVSRLIELPDYCRLATECHLFNFDFNGNMLLLQVTDDGDVLQSPQIPFIHLVRAQLSVTILPRSIQSSPKVSRM